MATLADAFLADLEDLEDDFGYQNVYEPDQNLMALHDSAAKAENDEEMKKEAEDAYFTDATVKISQMLKNPDFQAVMKEVAQKKDQAAAEIGTDRFTEEDEEYKLVSRCNTLVKEIEDEMFMLYNEVKSIYQQKSPQLENILQNPYEYLLVVHRIGDADDFSKIDFTDILPNQLIMTLTITATHSKSAPLEKSMLDRAIAGCEEAFKLNDHKRDVLLYLESRMSIFCPNLATLLSASLAAKLVTAAGGLLNLSRMPAQNIMLVGSQKKNLLGMAGHANHGVLYQSDLIMTDKSEHAMRAVRLVSGKAAIAARCDWHRTSQLGETGAQLRDEIQKAMIKVAQPPPAKQKKPLPKPDDVPCKKRGGKRHRALKEKFGQTDMQKQQNRIKFGEEAEQEISQEKMGFGLGMISVTSTRGGRADYVGGALTSGGKVKQARQKEAQRAAQAAKRQRMAAGAGARESGMSSSLAFTPVQGIELVNPQQAKRAVNPADRYFADSANFVNL